MTPPRTARRPRHPGYPALRPYVAAATGVQVARSPIARLFLFLRRLIRWSSHHHRAGPGPRRRLLRIVAPHLRLGGKPLGHRQTPTPRGRPVPEELQNFFGTQIELLESGPLQQLAFNRLQATKPDAIKLGDDGFPLAVSIRVSQAPKTTVFELTAKGSDPAYIRAYLDSLMDAFLAYETRDPHLRLR